MARCCPATAIDPVKHKHPGAFPFRRRRTRLQANPPRPPVPPLPASCLSSRVPLLAGVVPVVHSLIHSLVHSLVSLSFSVTVDVPLPLRNVASVAGSTVGQRSGNGCGCGRHQQISDHMPGRVGKQCRERYLNHLDPSLRHGPWTDEEEALLLSLHAKLNNQWAEIARQIPGEGAVLATGPGWLALALAWFMLSGSSCLLPRVLCV